LDNSSTVPPAAACPDVERISPSTVTDTTPSTYSKNDVRPSTLLYSSARADVMVTTMYSPFSTGTTRNARSFILKIKGMQNIFFLKVSYSESYFIKIEKTIRFLKEMHLASGNMFSYRSHGTLVIATRIPWSCGTGSLYHLNVHLFHYEESET